MPHDGVRDATHERPSQPAEPPASHDDQASPDLVGQLHDGLVSTLLCHEVGSGDLAPGLLYLRYLLVECLWASSLTAAIASS